MPHDSERSMDAAFAACLAKEEINDIFGQVDVDGSHALDLQEAKALVGQVLIQAARVSVEPGPSSWNVRLDQASWKKKASWQLSTASSGATAVGMSMRVGVSLPERC